jgi:hypothetical protein
MLPFGMTILVSVPQRSEIPEGLTNYPVYYMYTIFLINLERMFMEVSSIVIWKLDITLTFIDDSDCQNNKGEGSVTQRAFAPFLVANFT